MRGCSKALIERKEGERLCDYVERVLRFVRAPACLNTLSILTGIAPHRLSKIMNRLELQRRAVKVTNVYHSYWQSLEALPEPDSRFK